MSVIKDCFLRPDSDCDTFLDEDATEHLLASRRKPSALRRHRKPGFFSKSVELLRRSLWPILVTIQLILLAWQVHSAGLLRTPSLVQGARLVPGRQPNGLVPEFEYEPRVFLDHQTEYAVNFSSEASSLEVRRRWRSLLPKGSGWVHVDSPELYSGLLKPFTVKDVKDVYLLSWVHQLHCLYTVMDAYDAIVQFGPDGTERQPETGHGEIHVNHCFDYLRQAILCSMDSTLEGSVSDGNHGTSGWEVTHTCRNYESGKAWAESIRGSDEKLLLHENESRVGNGGIRLPA